MRGLLACSDPVLFRPAPWCTRVPDPVQRQVRSYPSTAPRLSCAGRPGASPSPAPTGTGIPNLRVVACALKRQYNAADMQRPQREGCAADAGGAECPEAPEGGHVSPLRRLQTTLFFVTSRALFPLLAASALVLVGAFALGGISRGSGGPLSLALGLVGLALLLTLACLVVQLLVYLAEADRQEVAGILVGAGGGALTSFACARIYPAGEVGSLRVFSVARLALTPCLDRPSQ